MIKKIQVLLFCLCLSNILLPSIVMAVEEEDIYSLSDLFAVALKQSETIQISEAEIQITEMNRKRALSVLIPRLTGFGDYTLHDEESGMMGFTISPKWSTTWGARISQTMTLNGRELTALDMAEKSIEESRLNHENTTSQYLYDVAGAYYEVLKAKKSFEIAKANLDRLIIHRDSVFERVRVGEVTRTALYRADAEVSEAKSSLILAENGLKLTFAFLERITGVAGIRDIREPGNLGIVFPEISVEQLKNEALEQRPDIRSARMRTRITEKNVKYMEGEYWPTLRAQMDYSNTKSKGASWEDDLSVGLYLDFTLYDGGLRGAELAQAVQRKRQAELQLKNQYKNAAIDVETVYLGLLTDKSRLASLNDKVRYAKENYKAVIRQFRYGLANSVDVMDANTLLKTAEEEHSESRYDYQIGLFHLEMAKGTLMETIQSHYLDYQLQ